MQSEIVDSLAAIEAERDRLDRLLASATAGDKPPLRTARDQLSQVVHGLRALTAPVVETVPSPASMGQVGNRLLMIGPKTATDTFRTRINIKPFAKAAPVAGLPVPTDDLTKIRGIDDVLAARLVADGVTSFATIAAWSGDEVRRIGERFGLGRAISRQNWIEQAALLRGRTVSQLLPDAVADPTTQQFNNDASNVPNRNTLPSAASPPDRLDLIRGVDAEIARRLSDLGVLSWADLSAWTRSNIDRIETSLGISGVVVRQNWIEQAALLAATGTTAHAARLLRGQFDALVPVPAPEPPLPLRASATPSLTASMPDPVIPVYVDAAPGTTAASIFDREAMPPRAGLETIAGHLLPNHQPPERFFEIGADRAAMAANDMRPVHQTTPQSADIADAPDAAPITSTLNVEDEEFAELLIAEADVMIVQRRSRPQTPISARRVPDNAARSLISRLKKAVPLDDIDPSSYAAYRDQIEEATVVIIKPPGTRRDR